MDLAMSGVQEIHLFLKVGVDPSRKHKIVTSYTWFVLRAQDEQGKNFITILYNKVQKEEGYSYKLIHYSRAKAILPILIV